MSRHSLSKTEVTSMLIGGMAGAIGGYIAAEQQSSEALAQMQIQQRSYSPPHVPSQKIALSGSRDDHAANVLALLKREQSELKSRRIYFNEAVNNLNFIIAEKNRPRGLRERLFGVKPENVVPLRDLIPMWKDNVVLPTKEEIIDQLNAETVWTKEDLENLAKKLSASLFADAYAFFQIHHQHCFSPAQYKRLNS